MKILIFVRIMLFFVRIMPSVCSVAGLEVVGDGLWEGIKQGVVDGIAFGLAQVPMDTWMEWGDEIGNAYDEIDKVDWDVIIEFSFWN